MTDLEIAPSLGPLKEPLTPRSRRRLTIVAQDPAVTKRNGRILTTEIEIPHEQLAPGPCGYRVHVVDYDSSTGTMQRPVDPSWIGVQDPTNGEILESPAFHAQNVYGIVMRALWRFEYALGRRLGWGFPGHQLKIAPHAFAEANAFFSPGDEALLFGYFGSSRRRAGRASTVFSCLSHDVVVHEATHALLNGLRSSFMRPSGNDQAAFHEAFADVVALLAVLSLPDVVAQILDLYAHRLAPDYRRLPTQIPKSILTVKSLRGSLLLGLAEEMGQELSAVRGRPLRRSAEELLPSPDYYRDNPEFLEPHRRGEILVAAVMNAFLTVWHSRLHGLSGDARNLDREWVAEEAAIAADHLLTMVIRAIDYTPPVHVDFRDYVSALLTADQEIRPDDSKYGFRDHIRRSFRDYGIEPSSETDSDDGYWIRPDPGIDYSQTHFESLQRDRDEVFRFVWQNRGALQLPEDAYTRVLSVRPAFRVNADDGFYVRETVIECLQTLVLQGRDARRLGIPKPSGLGDEEVVHLRGGVTLIFDEFGQLKYAIHKNLPTKASEDPTKHAKRLDYWFEQGLLDDERSVRSNFATLHRDRALDSPRAQTRQYDQERW